MPSRYPKGEKMAARTAATQSAMESTAAKAMEPTAKRLTQTEDVFEQIDRIYDSIARRAFEIFSSKGEGFGHDIENWFKAESELLHPVHVEMTEQGGAVNVSAEVPGFEAKDLEIKLEPSRLTISGKRESQEERKKGKTVYHEHCANEFLRVVDLPAEVDASKAEAKLKNGVLQMHMPKGASTKMIRVQVKPS
jgi:HSP20 family protein